MKKPKEKAPGQVSLSNRCVETQAQVQQVLQVIMHTSGALNSLQRRIAYDEGETGLQPVETEGQIAVENVLVAACARMEAILNDVPRWDDSFQRKVEKEYDELHSLQVKTISKQAEAAEEITSPHFKYRPDLHRMTDGRWLAIVGEVSRLEFSIYGVGHSARAALEAFDKAFSEGVPAVVVKHCQEREKSLDAGGKNLPPFPSNEQIKNDNEKLDQSGNDASGSPSPGR